ncbi:MAG: hypothetical protein P9M03_10260 [Candidatus Theseobacter exili]|nr:hypothetical protein [Candidatus Theseobacter exili]
MLNIYIIIAVVLIFILRKLWKKVSRLEDRIVELDNSILELDRKLRVGKGTQVEKPEKEETVQAEKYAAKKMPAIDQQSVQEPLQQELDKAKIGLDEKVLKREKVRGSDFKSEKFKKPKAAFWGKIEKQFLENWTGLIGTVIFVTGVGFLGIYSAVNMSEMYRFFLLVLVSAVLFVMFCFLAKRELWLKLALWLRSASGSVFLFACLGAGGIKGLHWIHNPFYALCVLILGIVVNLFLAYAGGKQVFASLHVLLSLIALSIAPQNQTTFIIAAIVALFGIALTYREKWDYHLLVTISLFFCYHLYWFFKIKNVGIYATDHYIGITTTILVSLAAAIVHYRKIYSGEKFEPLPCFVHIVNWFYFGVGLLLHDMNFKWKTVPIFLGAVAAYFLAKKARKMNIKWLYLLDTLIAQIMFIIGILSFYIWDVNLIIIIALIFLETLAFAKLMIYEKEILLFRISLAFIYIASVILIVASFKYYHIDAQKILVEHGIMLIIIAFATLFLHISLVRNKDKKYLLLDSISTNIVMTDKTGGCSILGMLSGVLMLCAYIQLYGVVYFSYLITVITSVIILIRNRYSTLGLSIGTLILILGSYFINWHQLSEFAWYNPSSVLIKGLPLYLVAVLAAKYAYIPSQRVFMRWIGIYLFVIHTMVLTYFIFNPISNLIPGVLWLMLSLPALEVSKWISEKYGDKVEKIGFPDRYILHTGYLLVCAFLFRHFLIHLQSNDYLGVFRIRLLIEMLALIIMGYWCFSKKPDSKNISGTWFFIQPLFLELILLFSLITVGIEADKTWQPVIWIIAAFVLFAMGKIKKLEVPRSVFYSLLFYYISIVQVAFLKGTYNNIVINWFEKSWVLGCVATLFQVVFLIVYYKLGFIETNCFPKALNAFSSSVNWINKNRNQAIFYPLFTGIAVFLYFSFDKSILTLLWVAECFVFFLVSIILKEKSFRYVSLAALAGCIVRLIFYDLSKSSTLTRAIVFLCVGILMLGMHSLYVKYKDRFLDENS